MLLGTAGLLYMADHLVPGKKTASNMRVRDALWSAPCRALRRCPACPYPVPPFRQVFLRGLTGNLQWPFPLSWGFPLCWGQIFFEVKDALAQGTQMELLPMLTGMVVAAVVGFWPSSWCAGLPLVRKFQGVYLVYGDFRHGDGGDRRGGKICPLNLEEKQEF